MIIGSPKCLQSEFLVAISSVSYESLAFCNPVVNLLHIMFENIKWSPFLCGVKIHVAPIQ